MPLAPINSGGGTTADPRELPSTAMTPGTFGLPWFVRATSVYNQPNIMPQQPVSTAEVFTSNMDRLLAIKNAERQAYAGPVQAPGAALVPPTQAGVAPADTTPMGSRRMLPTIITPSMKTAMGTNYSDESLVRTAKDYLNEQNATNRPYNQMDQINSLEENLPRYFDQAALKAYGKPVSFTKDSLGNDVPVYADNATQYLGLQVGQIGGFIPDRPSDNASDVEWTNYYNALRGAARVPLYTESSVMREVTNMGKENLTAFQKQMQYMGIYPPNTGITFGDVGVSELEYMKALMLSANQNGTDWSYQLGLQMDQFQARVDQGLSAPYGGSLNGPGGGGTGSPGTSSTQTTVQYSSTSLSQARSLLISVMQNALGRNPTDAEIRKFTTLLNGEERQSPTTTVTRTRYITDSKTKSVARTTPSGVDAERIAQEFVQSIDSGTPYENSQSNRYIDALVNWLGG